MCRAPFALMFFTVWAKISWPKETWIYGHFSLLGQYFPKKLGQHPSAEKKFHKSLAVLVLATPLYGWRLGSLATLTKK